MIFLRVLAVLAGCLVLIVPPLVMFDDDAAVARHVDANTGLIMMAGMVLVAASFIFVGFASSKLRKSPRLRALAALALAVPFAASGTVLWLGADAEELWGSALLFCFTVWLFVAFVYPGQRKRRRMRRRVSLPVG